MIVAVALDLGTTSIKAGLLSADGELSGVVVRPAPPVEGAPAARTLQSAFFLLDMGASQWPAGIAADLLAG